MPTKSQETRLKELAEGFWSTQVIRTAAQLDVADIIGTQDLTAEQVAREAGADAGAMYRLLRAMVSLGLCEPGQGKDGSGGGFRLTTIGRMLIAGSGSYKGRALFLGRSLYGAFSELVDSVRTGARAPSVRGDFESSTPEQVMLTQGAMAETSREAVEEAAKVYDFGRFSSILDVGGGFGGVIAYLLKRHPHMRADVLDLPNVMTGAEAFLAARGVADRARFIPGSFLEEIPRGYDCYHLKYILHDWDDEKCVRILKSCRAAMSAEATLVLLEMVVPDQIDDCAEHRFVMRVDMTMLTFGGKERTEAEYRDLFTRADFELTRVVPTQSAYCVVEGRPV